MNDSRSFGLKLLLFAVLLFMDRGSFAQNNNDDDYEPNRDSTWGIEFDMSELDYKTVKMDLLAKRLARIKHYNDSVLMVLKMKNIKWRSDSLVQLYDLLNGDVTTSYNAYSFFAGQYHSSLGNLNNVLRAWGMPKLRDMSYHLTNFLDYTWKRRRFVNDIFVSDGMTQDVSKGDFTVSYKFRSPINYSFGFCIIDSRRIQLYPFACLSWQTSILRFTNTSEQLFELGNNGYDTLIWHGLNNIRGVDYELKKREFVVNYGAELDFHLFYSKREKGVVIGIRAANAQALWSSGWVFQGKKSNQLSGVNIKDYYFDLVARIYFRRDGKRGTYDLRTQWWDH